MSLLKINICFLFQGISVLLIWNTFITLDRYFKERFTDKQVGHSVNYFLMLFTQVPNFIFVWSNIVLKKFRGNLETIVKFMSCVIMILMCILILVFYFDNRIPTNLFIFLIFTIVTVMSAANSVFQNAIYGLAAMFVPSSTMAVVLGSNISGCIVISFMLLTNTMSFTMFNQIMVFFISVSVQLALGTIFFILTSQSKEFKDVVDRNKNNDRPREYYPVYKTTVRPVLEYPTRWLLDETKISIMIVAVTYLTSLTIFPGIMANVQPNNKDFPFFTEITCFMGFNLFATLGVATSWVLPVKRKTLTFLAFGRLIFIPLFLLCSYYPFEHQRNIPVIFDSDYVYIAFVILMSFSSGYVGSLGMAYISKDGASDTKKAGLIAGATLVSGVLGGILLSGVMPYIV